MYVIEARNVHEALPLAIEYLRTTGVKRDSRNGPVLLSPVPVTTVYTHPCERVIFWPQRDANPFFHLYESLWMLSGSNLVAPLARYAKNILNYSDDGITQHAAYGYRWRKTFSVHNAHGTETDQLAPIARRLRENPEDRRCVLQMWDAALDLDKTGADFPCNLTATFQRDKDGRLDLAVFCRSNDIIWGCYGANAVHFSVLQEYMANWIGCPVGTYSQISINWHAYQNEVWEQVQDIPTFFRQHAPYEGINGSAFHVPMTKPSMQADHDIETLLKDADEGFVNTEGWSSHDAWGDMVYLVLKAHHVYKTLGKDEKRFGAVLDILNHGDQEADWIVASREWVLRREKAWAKKA